MAKILIVDDSKTSRKFLRNMLEDAGHEVVSEAVNGVEGVEKFRLYKPDVVTMDITMPVMDGIEAVREIIEIDPGAKFGVRYRQTVEERYGDGNCCHPCFLCYSE